MRSSTRWLPLFSALVFVSSLLTLSVAPAAADVKTRDKGQVKFEGMLGTMMRMFGGKALAEGIVSTNAVKGNRKATLNDTTGRIVDLDEQKVYDLDMKKKSYTVTTFEQLRQKLREAQERAAKDAPKETGEPAKPSGDQKEVEFDFDVKETGQTRSIAGYDTKQVIMTVTVREKGKTLEESGGLVLTADTWLGPEIPAMRELAEFEMKYWKAVAPETATGVSRADGGRGCAVSHDQAGDGSPQQGKEQPQRHAARDDDDVRRREEQGADRGAEQEQRQRRPERHARAQDREEGRPSASDDLHPQFRDARGRDHGGSHGRGDSGGFQAE